LAFLPFSLGVGLVAAGCKAGVGYLNIVLPGTWDFDLVQIY
jgi:hypothetical protein